MDLGEKLPAIISALERGDDDAKWLAARLKETAPAPSRDGVPWDARVECTDGKQRTLREIYSDGELYRVNRDRARAVISPPAKGNLADYTPVKRIRR